MILRGGARQGVDLARSISSISGWPK